MMMRFPAWLTLLLTGLALVDLASWWLLSVPLVLYAMDVWWEEKVLKDDKEEDNKGVDEDEKLIDEIRENIRKGKK